MYIEDKDFVKDTFFPDFYLQARKLKNIYYCSKKRSVKKYEYLDGTIKYIDYDRAVCFDTATNDTFTSAFVDELINKRFPIKMPYNIDTKKFKVYGRSCYLDENNKEIEIDVEEGDEYNATYYDYLITPTGEKIIINEYIREN